MARFDTSEYGSWEQDVATLAGSLVHEVKNPLSTLNINTQLLLEEWTNPQTAKEKRMLKRLDVMAAEMARIEKIINSFLRFTERQDLETAPGDVNALLGSLIEHNAEGLERRRIRVHFQPDENLGPVEFDENLLRQAFLNLLRNAEQAMLDGGELIIRTHHAEDSIEVEIIDTGEGIPEDRLHKIFHPYFSSKPDGTGLGLPTTLRIVRGHGGSIWGESEIGKGCQFVVVLPTKVK